MLIASTLTFWLSTARPERRDAEQFEINAPPVDRLPAAVSATVQTSAQFEQIFLEGEEVEGVSLIL